MSYNLKRRPHYSDSTGVSTLITQASAVRGKAVNALHQIPPFTATLTQLLNTLQNENVSFGEISDIVERDAVLAAHVLKLVNSALYARRESIVSVRRAVAILGVNKLRNLALSFSITRMWKTIKIPNPKVWSHGQFNLHSIAVAVMGDHLAECFPVGYPEGAFTAGLLHGIGKLMIVTGLPTEYEAILQMYKDYPGLSMEDAEREVIGCTHAELCAMALAVWKLPAEIQLAVATQSVPTNGITLGGVLHEAHTLVNLLDFSIPACACETFGTAEEHIAALGLQQYSGRLLQRFRADMDAMASFFQV